MSTELLNVEKNELELPSAKEDVIESVLEGISFQDPQSIMKYGQEATVEISQFADQILSSIQKSAVEDSGQMISKLNNLMTSFDKRDFEEEPKGLLNKIFKNLSKTADTLMKKYNSVGTEIDRIFVQIKAYENEITLTNNMLDEMYQNNMKYYELLENYISAGKLYTEKFKAEELPKLIAQKDLSQTGNINLNNACEMIEMMEQRLFDLEMAKMVALQTAPQIKLIQKGNYNLIRKINSAFVITLPIFKQSIIQAVTLKRQKIQAESMSALVNTTNEMLKKNAENIVTQSILTEKLASESTVKADVMESTWNTIMSGIQEIKSIQQQNKEDRLQSINRIAEVHNNLKMNLEGKNINIGG